MVVIMKKIFIHIIIAVAFTMTPVELHAGFHKGLLNIDVYMKAFTQPWG